MDNLVKYLGVIIVLLGTAGLAVPQFMGVQTNTMMLISLSVIVLGIVLHVIISKKKY